MAGPWIVDFKLIPHPDTDQVKRALEWVGDLLLLHKPSDVSGFWCYTYKVFHINDVGLRVCVGIRADNATDVTWTTTSERWPATVDAIESTVRLKLSRGNWRPIGWHANPGASLLGVQCSNSQPENQIWDGRYYVNEHEWMADFVSVRGPSDGSGIVSIMKQGGTGDDYLLFVWARRDEVHKTWRNEHFEPGGSESKLEEKLRALTSLSDADGRTWAVCATYQGIHNNRVLTVRR